MQTSKRSMRPSSSFVWMSDIHFDPYFGMPQAYSSSSTNNLCSSSTTTQDETAITAQFGCDSPWNLIQSAILEVSSHDPTFVVLTGDFSRHELDRVDSNQGRDGAVSQILGNITLELQAQLSPGTILVPVLGNNDVLPDYFLNVVDHESPQLKWIADTLLDLNVLSTEEAELFRYGGYYARTIGEIRLICLNTVVYSVEHTPRLPLYNSDPYDQFTWLEQELQSHKNVYILGHIPPTISSYAHDDMWDERFRLIYEQIVQLYASNIRAQFFGHFHDNEFRLLPSTNLLMFLGPSITPIYHSNPAFQVVHYQTTDGALVDIDYHVFNLSDPTATNWTRLHSFGKEYDLDSLTSSSIQTRIIDPIHDQNAQVITKFLFNYKYGIYNSNAMETCLENGWESCSQDWYCTFTSNSSTSFHNCRFGSSLVTHNSHLPDGIKIVLAVLGILALSCCLYLYLPCCSYQRRRAHIYDIPDVAPQDDVVSPQMARTKPTVTKDEEENEII